jgi:hypothetical protein
LIRGVEQAAADKELADLSFGQQGHERVVVSSSD